MTLGAGSPVITTLKDCGTRTRTSLVIHELKIAVVPTPNATAPIAPACGVCESVPMTSMPGSAYSSRIFEWQMACEPSRWPICSP